MRRSRKRRAFPKLPEALGSMHIALGPLELSSLGPMEHRMASHQCCECSMQLRDTSIKEAESAKAPLRSIWNLGTRISLRCLSSRRTMGPTSCARAISFTPFGFRTSLCVALKTMDNGHSCALTSARDSLSVIAKSLMRSTRNMSAKAKGSKSFPRKSSGLQFSKAKWNQERPTCSTRTRAIESPIRRISVQFKDPTCVAKLFNIPAQMRWLCATWQVFRSKHASRAA